MNKLLLFVLLASCEGRCDENEAAREAIGPGADCISEAGGALGGKSVCIYRNQLWVCQLKGVFFNTANCEMYGTITTASERP